MEMHWIESSRWRRAGQVAILAACVGVPLVPRVAEACSCIGGAMLLGPAAREGLPSSAGVLLETYCGGNTDPFAVTVNDTPAAFVLDPPLASDWSSFWVARIEPAPQPGDVVVVSACGDPAQDGGECPRGEPFVPILELTVGEPDTTAPAGGAELALTHRLGEFEFGCDSPAEMEVDIAVSGLDNEDEDDVLYTVELRNSGGMVVYTRTIHVFEPTPSLDLVATVETAPYDPAAMCASVTATDLSGNSTLVVDACGSEGPLPGDDTGGTGGDTGTADGTGGGGTTAAATGPVDDDGGAGTGGATEDPGAGDGDVADRGCGCRTRRGGGGAWWLAPLVLGAFGRRRRHAG